MIDNDKSNQTGDLADVYLNEHWIPTNSVQFLGIGKMGRGGSVSFFVYFFCP